MLTTSFRQFRLCWFNCQSKAHSVSTNSSYRFEKRTIFFLNLTYLQCLQHSFCQHLFNLYCESIDTLEFTGLCVSICVQCKDLSCLTLLVD